MGGKGVFEFEVEGKKVGFKFGMYAAGISERVAGCSIMELFQRIHGQKLVVKDDKTVVYEPLPGLTTISLLQYFYGGAVAYTGNEKLAIDEVADMIDEIGVDKAFQAFTESIQTYIPKKKQVSQEETAKIDQ